MVIAYGLVNLYPPARNLISNVAVKIIEVRK